MLFTCGSFKNCFEISTKLLEQSREIFEMCFSIQRNCVLYAAENPKVGKAR